MSSIQLTLPLPSYIEQIETRIARLSQQRESILLSRDLVLVQMREVQEEFQSSVRAYFELPVVKWFIGSVNSQLISIEDDRLESRSDYRSKATQKVGRFFTIEGGETVQDSGIS